MRGDRTRSIYGACALIPLCLLTSPFSLTQMMAEQGTPEVRRIRVTATPLNASLMLAQSPKPSSLVYANDSGPFFQAAGAPRSVMEEINLVPQQGDTRIEYIEFGIYRNADFSASVDINFYDMFDSSATPVNSNRIEGLQFYLDFSSSAVTGPHILRIQIPRLVPTSNRIAVELRFTDPSSNTTALFSGGGVRIGSSPDNYYADADNNGIFDPSESFNFGGPPNLANLMLVLHRKPPTGNH